MTRPRQINLAFCIALVVSPRLHAQPNSNSNDPTSTTADGSIEHGMRLLSNVRDNVLSFDDPAFYWFCRYVNTPEGMAGLRPVVGTIVNIGPANKSETTSNQFDLDAITPIKFLLERPGDYRGKPVIIEGTLVAKWSWSVDNRDVPSPLHQCEIAVASTRALAAVVTTEPVDDIPIRSRVRAKGYFIKVRAFQTTGGESGFGPLLVARNLTPICSDGALATSSGGAGSNRQMQMWILTGTLIAAVIWLMMRRRARVHTPASTRTTSPATRIAPATTSDNDFDWMTGKSD